jgi:hypothetical protein
MTTSITNFKPVAKNPNSSNNIWLLIPIGETLELDPEKDDRAIFYLYLVEERELKIKPEPLQVWCKHMDFVTLSKRDLKLWEKITKEL